MKKKLLKRAIKIGILLAVVLASAAAFAAPDGLMIRTENILDPNMGNIVAATVAVPEGWNMTTGKVLWDFKMFTLPALVVIEARNPKDDAYFGLVSDMAFACGRDSIFSKGIRIKEKISAADYITEMLYNQPDLSDMKITKVEKPQAIADAIQKQVAEFQKVDPSATITTDCAVVHYTCTKNGLRYEGATHVAIVRTERPNFTTWNTSPLIAISAREGKLAAHEKDLAVLIGNTSVSTAWYQTLAQVILYLTQQVVEEIQTEMTEQTLRHNASLQRQLQETHEYTMRQRQRSSAYRQEALSNTSRGWSNVISGIDTWDDGRGVYSAPTGYNHAWSNGSGQTYYTNDSTFNPNYTSGFSGNWTPMERTPW